MIHSSDDTAARDRVLTDLDTTFLVEASAGTGKTGLVIGRLMSLIRSGRASLRQIAAITFTEKAAGELRLRLRQGLEDELRGSSPPEEIRTRYLSALADLPLAPISTIHAFAAQLLRERPVESGLDPEARVADQLESELLLAEGWHEWQEKAFAHHDPELSEALAAGLDPQKLWNTVKLLADNRDVGEDFRLETPPGMRSSETAVQEILPPLVRFFDQTPTRLEACRNSSDNGRVQMEELLHRWNALPDHTPQTVGGWLTRDPFGKAAAGNKNNWSPPEVLTAYKEDYDRLKVPLDDYRALRHHEVISGLVSRLQSFLDVYHRKRRERGVLDFQDLLLLARNLLRDDLEVREYFQGRYRFLLVDEFQDTDPLQAEIAFFLAEDGAECADWRAVRLTPGKLFLVGDPKQSIYRFRRADMEVYQLAREVICCQEGKGGEVLELTRNFRSAVSVQRWVNHAFSRVIEPVEGEHIQPPYLPLVPADNTRDFPGEVRILTPSASRRDDLGERAGTEALVRMEAELIGGAIEALRRDEVVVRGPREAVSHPARLGDMALLLPTYVHIEAFENELTRRGLPYRLMGGKGFYRRVETHALISLLLAVENPRDPTALVAALRSPAFAVSDEELFWAAEEGILSEGAYSERKTDRAPSPHLAESVDTIRRFHRMRNELPLAVLLGRMLRETQLMAVVYLMPQGEQRAVNLQKIVETARELDRAGRRDFRTFAYLLMELMDRRAAEVEPTAVEEDEDALRVLTIHGAKGLEFPVVFLADLASGDPTRQRWPSLLSHRRRQTYALGLGRGFTTWDYDELRRYEVCCTLAEECRLLYVAATRARNYLYVVHPRPDKIKSHLRLLEPGLPLPATMSDGDLLSSEAGPRVEDETRHPSPPRQVTWGRVSLAEDSSEEEGRDAIEKREAAWRGGLDRARVLAGRHHRRIHPSKLHPAEEEAVPLSPAPASAGDIRGTQVGNLVHEVLARAFELERATLFRLVDDKARALNLTPKEADRGRRLVDRALDSALMERARRAARVMTEVPFARPAEGGTVEGRIDLLFEEDDGLVLVDYKTDAVGEEELKERALNYRDAVAEYRRSAQLLTGVPVEAFLYFIEPDALIPVGKVD